MKKTDLHERLQQAETGEAAVLLRDMLRACVRQALYDLAEEEIRALCGPKHHPGDGRSCYRAGSSPSVAYVSGERTALVRPRVRRWQGDGSSDEVYLRTWKAAQDPDAWEDALMRAILCGVSTRDQQYLHASELRGMSRSSVSRLWQRKAAELVHEMQGRDLRARPVLALMLDGVHLADGLCVLVAVGFYVDGSKEVLGFRVGGSENAEVTRDLMADLVRRGLHVAAGTRLLAVLDGSKPLRTALLEFFADAVIQRCLVHKERNIRRYLPKKHWLRLAGLFNDLRRAQGAQAAIAALQAIEDFLQDKNKAARVSLEEAGAELLAFHRLNVPSTLNKTFLSTNCIENTFTNLRRHIGRVCRWRQASDHPERWIASGLKLAEQGFRRIHGYKDLPALQETLRKPVQQEEAVA